VKEFIIKRLVVCLALLVFTSGITFFLLELAPGDPALMMLGQDATQEGLTALRREMGLDQPLLSRYATFLGDLFQGDMGVSYQTHRPVSQEIAATFPATLELSVASMVIAIIIGVPVGITCAIRQYSLTDRVVRFAVLIAVSLPVFWLGLMIIYLFSIVLGWFPSFGRGGLRHLVLPAVTMSCYSLAIIVRMTRSSMLEVLRCDYITATRAKGIHEFYVIYKHALRNALVPVITIIGLQFGVLLGGAVITETIFAWPGLGRLMVQAIFARDYPIIRGGVLMISACSILITLFVDIICSYINPSLKPVEKS